MNPTFYLDIIADYTSKSCNDLAFIEVRNSFISEANKKNLKLIINSHLAVEPFNTIETAFAISQLALNSKIYSPNSFHVIFHNTAPRKDIKEKRINNDGEGLAFCFVNNTIVIGVNSGYCFSLLKDYCQIYKINCTTEGSQFRSRDIFPAVAIDILEQFKNANYPLLDQKLVALNLEKFLYQSQLEVGDIENNIVVYVDGYGNIKTNLTLPTESEKIKIKINSIEKEAYVSKDGIFGVKDGQLVLAQGSSGWSYKEQKVRFSEISLRGGNAAYEFITVKAGDKISIY
jgi:hypothetical protein